MLVFRFPCLFFAFLGLQLMLSEVLPAQIRIGLYSDSLKPGNSIPDACGQAALMTQALVNAYPHPQRWKFVIVCDDVSWNTALAHARIDAEPERVYGATFLEQSVTLIRARSPDARAIRSGPTLEHVVAHELAHIKLNTRSEQLAESTARVWLRERSTQIAQK